MTDYVVGDRVRVSFEAEVALDTANSRGSLYLGSNRGDYLELEYADWTGLTVTRLNGAADALEELMLMRETLSKVEAVVIDALSNADDSGVGWDAEVSASALFEILKGSS